MTRRFRYDAATDSVVEANAPGKPRKAGAWAKPKHCEALAVEPEHVPYERQLDQEQGLGDVEYDKSGAPVFYSQGKYDAYVKAKGYVNKTSGRGVTTGKSNAAVDSTLLKRILERDH